MPTKLYIKILTLICFCLSTSAHAIVPMNFKQRLPTYRGIERDVEFWEQIFSQYHSGQCVYHDKDNLKIIYLVKTLKYINPRARDKQIAQYNKSIQDALKNLEHGKKPTTFLEQRVYHAVPKEIRTAAFFKKARYSVRCQRGLADGFKTAVQRSKKYMPVIKAELKKNNMPEELAYLPHLESGFNLKALSKVGARGLWQIMPSVGREHGLRVTRYRDDRLDPRLATRVAVKKLSKYYRDTKGWGLALTSYNYGPNGIRRAIEKYGTNDYTMIREKHKTAIFGFASKNFYPSFLAVRNIAKKIEKQELADAAAKKSIEIANSGPIDSSIYSD